jgi:hypothetical protein
MDFEDSGLLGASDEEGWDREGLFKAVDELCGLNGGQKHLGTTLNSLEPSPPALTYPTSFELATCDNSVLISQPSRPPLQMSGW